MEQNILVATAGPNKICEVKWPGRNSTELFCKLFCPGRFTSILSTDFHFYGKMTFLIILGIKTLFTQ